MSPEGSVFHTLQGSQLPLPFDTIVERVQARQPFTREMIAASLASLISKRRVFLNQERTGFLAVRHENLSRANRKAIAQGLRYA